MIYRDPTTGLQRSVPDRPYDPNPGRTGQDATGYSATSYNSKTGKTELTRYNRETRTDGNGNPYTVDVAGGKGSGDFSKNFQSTGILNPDGSDYRVGVDPFTNLQMSQGSIPTKAPVVSSSMAAEDMNTRVVPGMKEAIAGLQKTQADKAAQTAADTASKTTATKTADTSTTTPDTSTQYKGGDGKFYKTQEDSAMNTPELGHMFIYGPGGQRAEVPVGSQLPIGFTATHPDVAKTMAQPMEESTVYVPGGSVKKMSDGTYANYKEDGTFAGYSDQGGYNRAQKYSQALDDIDKMKKGDIPLKPEQQAILDAMSTYIKMASGAISQQGAAQLGAASMALTMGNVTGASFAAGQLQSITSATALEMAKSGAQMMKQLGDMQIAFKNQQSDQLKDAYNAYTNEETKRQNILKVSSDRINKVVDDQQAAISTANNAADNDIRKYIEYARGIATPEQLDAAGVALQNHDVAGAMKALGDSTRERSPAGKEYDDYVSKAKAAGIVPMGWNEYQTADANRKARIAAAGAQRIGEGAYSNAQERVIQDVNKTVADSQVYKRYEGAKNFSDGVKDSLDQETGPGDIAAINQYQKVIDEGAVTRDQDVKLITSAQTLGGQLQTFAKGRGLTGEKLSPELRQQMRDVVDALAEGKKKALLNSPYVASQTSRLKRASVKAEDSIVGSLSFSDTIPTVAEEALKEGAKNPLGLKIKAGETKTNNQLGI